MYVTHSQVDVETEFGVVLRMLILFLWILASIKWFLAFYKFLQTAKGCWLLPSDILPCVVCCSKIIVLKQWEFNSCTCERPQYSHDLFRAEM